MTSCNVNRRATILRILNLLQALCIAAWCGSLSAAPPVVEQVNQALDIAERAAKHGLTDLSMTAVRRALEFGLPTVSVSQQPVALVHSGARIDTAAALPVPPLEAMRLRVPQTILRLVSIWQRAEQHTHNPPRENSTAENPHASADQVTIPTQVSSPSSAQIFETLMHVVLPRQRPHEVFLYSLPIQADPLQPARLPVVHSVAQELVAAGAACGRLASLQQQLMQSGAELTAEGRLLQLLCSIRLRDAAGIQQHSEVLSEMLQAGARRETALLAAVAGQDLLNSGHQIPAASSVLSAAARTLAAIQQHDAEHQVPVTAVLLMAARSEFSAERPDAALELLKLCLQQAGDDDADRATRSRHQHLIAQQLVARQHLASASELLGASYVQNFTKRWLNTALPVDSAGSSAVRPAATQPAATQPAATQPAATQPVATQPVASDTADSPPASTSSQQQAATAKLRPAARIVAAQQPIDADDGKTESWTWICILDTQNGTSRRLFALPDFQHVDHLAIDSGGQRLAFDATFPGEPITSSGAIYTVDLTSLQLQHLGPGVQPSWSPLGRRLVCNRFSPDRGVWIVRTDGSHAVLLDGAGWSGLWSPDGSRIAYTRSVGERSEFMLYNVVEDDFVSIATGRKVSPAQSSWNFCWTQDSQHLLVEAFRSGSGNRADAASSADADSRSFVKVKVAGTEPAGTEPFPQLQRRSQEWNVDFGINTDASQLLLWFKASPSASEQLAELSAETAAAPVVLAGQPTNRRNTSPVWLPDGRRVLFISRPAK